MKSSTSRDAKRRSHYSIERGRCSARSSPDLAPAVAESDLGERRRRRSSDGVRRVGVGQAANWYGGLPGSTSTTVRAAAWVTALVKLPSANWTTGPCGDRPTAMMRASRPTSLRSPSTRESSSPCLAYPRSKMSRSRNRPAQLMWFAHCQQWLPDLDSNQEPAG
jgi:hypothetical protein